MRPRARHFVGRAELLAELESSFSQTDQHAAIVLTGAAGVGKSELAAHLASRLGRTISWWINGESLDTARSGFASLLTRLGIDDQGKPIEVARAVLSGRSDWLLVLDAVEDERMANMLTASTRAGGAVVATSLAPSWGLTFKATVVPPLATEASVQLMTARGVPTGPDLLQVVATLGGLPLPLQQAAGFMTATATSPGDYLPLLRERSLDILDRGDPGAHQSSTVAAFRVAVTRAADVNPDARPLLQALSICGADTVPTDLLRDLFGDPIQLSDAIEAVARFSLVTPSSDGILCHGVVQLLMRAYQGDDVAELVHGLMTAIGSLPRDTKVTTSQVVSHLEALQAQSPTEVDQQRAFRTASNILRDRGNADQAVEFAQISLTAAHAGKQAGLIDESDVLETKIVKGRALAEKGSFTEAESIFVDALNRARSSQAWKLAGAVCDDLAHLHLVVGDLQRSSDFFDEAAKFLARTSPGRDRDEMEAVHFANRGNFERHVGRPADAVKSLRHAMELVDEVEGESPELATVHSNLGLALLESGELADALRHARFAHEMDVSILGENHPNVARDLNNLGLVLHEVGKLDEAREAFEQCLAINTATRGLKTSPAAIATNNLARVLEALGQRDAAYSAFTDALAIHELLNPESADVAVVLVNRALILADEGKHGPAMRDLKRALDLDLRIYGPDHLQVATDMNNIGRLLVDMGLLSAANKWLERSISVVLGAVGKRHIAYAFPLLSRTYILEARGLRSQALADAREANQIFTLVLGGDHESTRQAMARVRSLEAVQ